MSSLLTNTSAMVALQTMKNINKDMSGVQNEISTGKRIANARDNAALWGISTTMQTDVSGFKAISESLSLGSATLSVARDAAETITGLLDTMKGKIVAAQEENVDRGKIQADVTALRDQINTVVKAAQFNGLNLLNGRDTTNILASLNRDSAGNVESSSISFEKQDLTTTAAVVGTGASTTKAGYITVADASNGGVANTATFEVTGTTATSDGLVRINVAGVDVVASIGTGAVLNDVAAAFVTAINDNDQLKALGVTAAASTATVTLTSTNSFENLSLGNASGSVGAVTFGASSGTEIARRAEAVNFSAAVVDKGDSYKLTIGATDYDYVAGEGETMSDVVKGLERLINSDAAAAKEKITAWADFSGASPVLYVDNGSGAALAVADTATTGGTKAGGLRGLEAIDVTTDEGTTAALAAMENLIQASISAAAEFGSSQGRIDTQLDFVGKIMDGLTSGIGTLVDADMEAASARLQALQVQQQLGIQALSIANQSPQNILALFR
jgi:flagellin